MAIHKTTRPRLLIGQEIFRKGPHLTVTAGEL